MSLEDKKKEILFLEKRADRLLKHRAEKLKKIKYYRTSYTNAVRIKEEKLLKKNKDEKGWPGGRTNFEIDRDQILYNKHFPRLARKTQVFIGQRNVFFRSRLMHTLEVVQFCRSVAQKQCLNIDLVEAIAYGHDIGHTPFGHAGENALNLCLYEYFIRRCLNFTGNPTKPILAKIKHDVVRSYENEGLWKLIDNMAKVKPSSSKIIEINRLKKLAGEEIVNKLIDNNIIHVEAKGDCYFNKPLEWNIETQQKKILKTQFFLQHDDYELFAHNIHALRVILYNKESVDITKKTAYGIISHSRKKAYSSFDLKLPGKKSFILTKAEHETPEAFLVRNGDEICFVNSDITDGITSKILNFTNLGKEDRLIICELAKKNPLPSKKSPSNSERLQNCESFFDFRSNGAAPDYKYNKRLKSVIDEAREIIERKVYPVLAPRQIAVKRIIRDLFWLYITLYEEKNSKQEEKNSNARNIEKEAFNQLEKQHKIIYVKHSSDWVRKVTDFIAHFTDDEAIGAHTALFSPDQAPWAQYFLEVPSD